MQNAKLVSRYTVANVMEYNAATLIKWYATIKELCSFHQADWRFCCPQRLFRTPLVRTLTQIYFYSFHALSGAATLKQSKAISRNSVSLYHM